MAVKVVKPTERDLLTSEVKLEGGDIVMITENNSDEVQSSFLVVESGDLQVHLVDIHSGLSHRTTPLPYIVQKWELERYLKVYSLTCDMDVDKYIEFSNTRNDHRKVIISKRHFHDITITLR